MMTPASGEIANQYDTLSPVGCEKERNMTEGGMQNLTVINESGVFSLIIQSKMPDARRFKRWVTAEILPTLRKTDGYVLNEEEIARHFFPSHNDEEIEIITTALKEISEMNQRYL